MTTELEKKIIPELVDVASKLNKSGQETLLRLGQDIIFIDKVKRDARRK